ncbi:hypothetical protein GF340_04705 [Candidatus Peregrinibacteria bacterium]|nr:hypothetical protein [Candidatus Peregrinibacteria bacterium]
MNVLPAIPQEVDVREKKDYTDVEIKSAQLNARAELEQFFDPARSGKEYCYEPNIVSEQLPSSVFFVVANYDDITVRVKTPDNVPVGVTCHLVDRDVVREIANEFDPNEIMTKFIVTRSPNFTKTAVFEAEKGVHVGFSAKKMKREMPNAR